MANSVKSVLPYKSIHPSIRFLRQIIDKSQVAPQSVLLCPSNSTKFTDDYPVINNTSGKYFNINANVSLENTELKECIKHQYNSIYSCDLNKEFKSLFTNLNLDENKNETFIMCMNYKAENDMTQWNGKVEQERESLAKSFIEKSIKICEKINSDGYWADFIDPYSGKPFFSAHTNDALFETDPRLRRFNYRIRDLGCCKVLSHPLWNEHIFAGFIFTNMAPNALRTRLESI